MTLTNSETSRAVMSLARLEARAACSRGAERACRLLPALRPRRRWGRFSRVTGLGRDPWQPFTFPGSFHILTFSFLGELSFLVTWVSVMHLISRMEQSFLMFPWHVMVSLFLSY